MTPLDYLIAVAYLLGMLLMAARLARRQRSDKDYFVGGRNLPWWALGLSTLATQSSANSFIGIPAFVALVPGGGLVWLQVEIALPLALAVVALVLVPVFRGLGLISIFEFLELRFDRSTRQWLSAVFLLSRGLATAVALYATALVVSVLTGWSLTTSVLVAGGVTVAYDLMGGMRAVVWSDVLQMALILLGLVLCIVYAVTLAGGWQAVVMAVEPDRLAAISLGHGLGDGDRAPLWGFVIGGFVLYVAYYGVDQTQVQRQLSARSVADAQRVLVANAMLRFPLTALYAVLGLALAAALLQSPALRQAVPADRPDLLVPRFIELHLPMGLRGLLLVALLAAAMSSLDSALNSLAAATLEDFVQKPGAPARRSLRQSRLCTLAWGVLITWGALSVGHAATGVVETINRVGAMFYGPLLAAFLCGLFLQRATGRAVRRGVLSGLLCNLAAWWLLGTQLFWMWWNVTGLVVAVLTVWVLSPRGASTTAAPSASQATRLPPAGQGFLTTRSLLVLMTALSVLIAITLLGLGWRSP